MDALKRLREAAAEKRGAAIKRAKDEHIKTARKIAELEGGTSKPQRWRQAAPAIDLLLSC